MLEIRINPWMRCLRKNNNETIRHDVYMEK